MRSTKGNDHYETLGVERSAERAVIDAAFHRISTTLANPANTIDERADTDARQAYETLSDPRLRASYDAHLAKRESLGPQGHHLARAREPSGLGAGAGAHLAMLDIDAMMRNARHRPAANDDCAGTMQNAAERFEPPAKGGSESRGPARRPARSTAVEIER